MTRTEDRLAINDVLVRYCTGIDTRDWEYFASVFTPEVQADYGSIGSWSTRDALVADMVAWHAPLGLSMHQVSNVAVTFVDTAPDLPDRARSSAYVDVVLMNADGRTGTSAKGTYADELVRTDSGWRITRRRFTLVLLTAVENLDRPTVD